MYNFGSFDAFIVKPTIMPDFARNLLHYCGCIGFLSPMHKKIPDSYSKREGGNPRNSRLSSQQWMVVHYPRMNSYAEHKVSGKTYN